MTNSFRTTVIAIILVLALAGGYSNAQTISQKKEPNNPATKKADSVQQAGSASAVTGSGTAGQLTRWLGTNGTSYVIGDSIITEDKFGRIGIGTISPTSKLTVQGTIETTTGGLKFPDGTIQTTAGLSTIAHDSTLTGNGTTNSPLGIANAGVGTNQLASSAVTSSKIALGAVGTALLSDLAVTSAKIAPEAVTTAQLANNSVTAAKVAPGQIVKSINGLTDNLAFAAGPNITITPAGNTLTIAATGSSTPATTAFQATIIGNWGDGDGIAQGTLAIPAGKRLVVEFVSITISLVLGQSVVDTLVTSTVDGVQVSYRLAVSANSSFPTSPFSHTVDKPVRIYSDGGTSLNVSIARTPASGGASFTVAISGYLVDLP